MTFQETLWLDGYKNINSTVLTQKFDGECGQIIMVD